MKKEQHEYFDQAYRTGSDIWTHIPYMAQALGMLPALPADALILDVGSGRGLWALKLVRLGYRVLGIDTVESAIKLANKDIKLEGFEGKARFMLGDVLDIPFTENSFDMVTDIGLLQHLYQSDWQAYAAEISRVTKRGSYYLNVSLSRETTRFLGWSPKHAESGSFEKFGVSYYFFTEQEMQKLFAQNFTMIDQKVRYFDMKTDPGDAVALVFTLFQRK